MKTKRSTKEPIPCRLEQEFREALAAEAAERNTTISDVVRDYVIEGLKEAEARRSVYQALEIQRAEIEELRKDIALVAEAVLCGAGKFTEEEAEDWVEKQLLSK